jgi:hypothetical protein
MAAGTCDGVAKRMVDAKAPRIDGRPTDESTDQVAFRDELPMSDAGRLLRRTLRETPGVP